MNITEALNQLVAGKDLSQTETAGVFQLIMTGEATPAQIGAFLAAIRLNGDSPQEFAGAATSMRELST